MRKQLVYITTVSLLLMGSLSFSTFAHNDVSPLLEDVNKDSIVDIRDLVLVAAAFGQPADRNVEHNPDVNRDGTVDVLDLVRISNSFGETPKYDNSTYHEIQDYIFDKSCVNTACHGAPANAGGLNLAYENSYHSLVGQTPRNPTAAEANMKLVDPGNPENSFILTKLMGPTAPELGARMPFAAGPLHDGKIEAIRTWIVAGAPEKEQLAGIGDLAVLRDPEETFQPPAPPPSGQGYQLHLPQFKIEPGTELEVFYATQITNENGNPPQGDIFVNGFDIFYPTGSHHFILYRITRLGLLPSRNILEKGVVPGLGVNPQDTFRVVNTENSQNTAHLTLLDRLPLIGSQRAETSIRFPEGVALRIAGDAIFDMNSHYVNLLGTKTLIGETYVNLYTLPPEEVKYEARGFAVSNKDIEVPPGTTRVTEGEWLVDNELKLLRLLGYGEITELNVFQLTSHMHRHGELFEINRISTGELLHRSVAYDNAPFDLLDPPILLTAGDGLRFQCAHSNYDTDQTIRYGLTSEDEMAIMFGSYYIPITME